MKRWPNIVLNAWPTPTSRFPLSTLLAALLLIVNLGCEPSLRVDEWFVTDFAVLDANLRQLPDHRILIVSTSPDPDALDLSRVAIVSPDGTRYSAEKSTIVIGGKNWLHFAVPQHVTAQAGLRLECDSYPSVVCPSTPRKATVDEIESRAIEE